MNRPSWYGSDVANQPAEKDLSRLWYSDPTGETAIRNVLNANAAGDFAVIDNRGNVVFRINREVLTGLLPSLTFTLTRRGRSNIRAHKKKTAAINEAATSNATVS